MGKIKAWTKQHVNVWKELEECGRYTVQRKYVAGDMGEQKELLMIAYEWLTRNSPKAAEKPGDVSFPVWLSLEQERTMNPEDGYVILELEIDEEMPVLIDVTKWSTILNLSYLPFDDRDAAEHKRRMKEYGISDVQAFMTPFYPEVKREIMESWKRLFDDAGASVMGVYYGIIWEIRREWVTTVIR